MAISGNRESYGGRYLPLLASAVLDGNKFGAARNVTPINLQSVLVSILQ